jgi:putative endonuclease
MLARLIFAAVDFVARKGLAAEPGEKTPADARPLARRTGLRGETYAYWYLRRHGYVFVARNYTAPGLKGEIDLIGYDGPVLVFVEVKTRTADADRAPLTRPEDAITPGKREHLTRMARHFVSERRLRETQSRFDVVAIESRAGSRPVVRLHKAAF